MLAKICPTCGNPTEGDGPTRCHECIHTDTIRTPSNRLDKRPTAERGYGNRWRRLSLKARAIQDWCSDCGSPYDLTADHSTRAWQRYQLGKPIRLQDIDVVCRRCNTDRGEARPDSLDSMVETRQDPEPLDGRPLGRPADTLGE